MPATGQSANAIEFSFDGPNRPPAEADLQAAVEAVAGNALEGVKTPAAAPAEPATLTTPAPAESATLPTTASPESPTAETAAPTASSEDLRTFKIVVDGQEMEVTEADLKAGHMRHRDYTQKTQRLAEQARTLEQREREWQSALARQQEELAAIDQFLRNRDALDRYIQQAFGQAAPQPPQIDPNKPLTVDEVAKIAAYNAEQVRRATLAEIDQRSAQQQAQVAQAARQQELAILEREVDTHIGSLVQKFPVLQKFEGIEDELIGMASKFQPRTLDEAKARLQEAAERKVATIRAIADEEKKQAAVRARQVQQTTTEPTGGRAPAAQPARKLSLDHRDRAARIEAGVADLQAFLSENR